MNHNVIIFIAFTTSIGYLYKETTYSTVAGFAVGLGLLILLFIKANYDQIEKIRKYGR